MHGPQYYVNEPTDIHCLGHSILLKVYIFVINLCGEEKSFKNQI